MPWTKLNILGLTDEEINNSKIELNMQAGVGGESYIDLTIVMKRIKKTNLLRMWLWGWYGNQRNFRPGHRHLVL